MKLCPICHRCYEDTDNVCVHEDHASLVPSRPGSRLINERYRLDRLLGRGGVGAVYAGTHIELDRPVAIKLLLSDFITDQQAVRRFRREARATARINHPNVAEVYDYGTLPTSEAYIVMEMVDGQTLRDYMKVNSPLPLANAVAIAAQVADAVEAAHRCGIVHRDLKPSNIILTRDHYDHLQAKVVDFGIAKIKEHVSSSEGPLTTSGSFIGTPRYMSPEQSAGDEIDSRSDIYSLGVILYEMLAGKPPIDAPSVTAIALKHIHEKPQPLKELRPDLPEQLSQLVMQSLNKEPSERPQTAAEVAARLREQIIGGGLVQDTENPTLKMERLEDTEPATKVSPRRAAKIESPPVLPAQNRSNDTTETQEPHEPILINVADAPVRKHHLSALFYISLVLALTVGSGAIWFLSHRAHSVPSVARKALSQPPAPSATRTQQEPSTTGSGTTNVKPNTGGSKQTPAEAEPTPTDSIREPADSFRDVSERRVAQDENDRADLREALNNWVTTTNTRDLSKQKSMYAPTVSTFYRARHVPRDAVIAEKARVFGNANVIDVRVGEPEITFSRDRQVAIMRFRKQYVIDGGGQNRRGEVIQHLRWVRTNSGWKINGERDLQVIH